jgi:hypothetical protein
LGRDFEAGDLEPHFHGRRLNVAQCDKIAFPEALIARRRRFAALRGAFSSNFLIELAGLAGDSMPT